MGRLDQIKELSHNFHKRDHFSLSVNNLSMFSYCVLLLPPVFPFLFFLFSITTSCFSATLMLLEKHGIYTDFCMIFQELKDYMRYCTFETVLLAYWVYNGWISINLLRTSSWATLHGLVYRFVSNYQNLLIFSCLITLGHIKTIMFVLCIFYFLGQYRVYKVSKSISCFIWKFYV